MENSIGALCHYRQVYGYRDCSFILFSPQAICLTLLQDFGEQTEGYNVIQEYVKSN